MRVWFHYIIIYMHISRLAASMPTHHDAYLHRGVLHDDDTTDEEMMATELLAGGRKKAEKQ